MGRQCLEQSAGSYSTAQHSTAKTGFLPESYRSGPSETSQARAHRQNKISISYSPLTTTTTSAPTINPKPFPPDQGFRQRPPASATRGHHTAHSFPHTSPAPRPPPAQPHRGLPRGPAAAESKAPPHPAHISPARPTELLVDPRILSMLDMAAQQRFGPAQGRAGRLRPLSFPLPVLWRLLLPVVSTSGSYLPVAYTSGSPHFRQLPLPPTPTGAPRRKRACRLPVSSVSVSSPSDPAVGRQARPDCLRAVGFGPGRGRQYATGPRGAPERRNAGL